MLKLAGRHFPIVFLFCCKTLKTKKMAEAPVQQPGDVFAALENNLRPIKVLEVRFFLSLCPAMPWIKCDFL